MLDLGQARSRCVVRASPLRGALGEPAFDVLVHLVGLDRQGHVH